MAEPANNLTVDANTNHLTVDDNTSPLTADERANHLTVLVQAYHTYNNQTPFAVAAHYSQFLTTKEQVYERHTTVDAEWQPLNLGWLCDASLIIIRNEEDAIDDKNTDPAEADQAQIDACVIELSFDSQINHLEIVPESFFCGAISKDIPCYIRSRGHPTRFSLYAFPI